jgi:hypothetical protein
MLDQDFEHSKKQMYIEGMLRDQLNVQYMQDLACNMETPTPDACILKTIYLIAC